MKFKEEVELVQSLFFGSLNTKSNNFFGIAKRNNIINAILKKESYKLSDCFGKFGLDIYNLFNNIYIDHPCVYSKVNDFFNSEILTYMDEVLNLYDTITFYKCNGILNLIKTVFENLLIDDFTKIGIDTPPRLIISSSFREKIRKNRRMSRIFKDQSFSEFEPSEKDWIDSPDSFQYFVRLNNKPIDSNTEFPDINEAIKNLKSVEMYCQATSLSNYLDLKTGKNRKMYCGFQEISISKLICILGKVHGVVFDNNEFSFKLNCNREVTEFLLNTVCIPTELLTKMSDFTGGFKLKNDNTITLYEFLQYSGGSLSWEKMFSDIDNLYPFLKYCARSYISNNFKEYTSFFHNLNYTLDHFHDCNGMPVFDYIILVVPTIIINNDFLNKDKKYYFKHNIITYASDKNEASIYLDELLVKNKIVNPIIVGQKDGAIYPICYMN